MSGCSYEAICPNCGSYINMYSDHKPFDYLGGTCLDCGFDIQTVTSQLELEALNSLREDQNDYCELKEGDEGFFPKLKKLPKISPELVSVRAMQAKKEIRDFLLEISEQDNRGTTSPIYYVIRSEVEVPAPVGCGDITEYYDEEDPEMRYDSVDEYIKYQKEYHSYKDMIPEEREEFDQKMENADLNLVSYSVNMEWKEEGLFLTEKDAKEHLQDNKHHYSKEAHTYVKSAWRAEHLNRFYINMFKYFGIPKGKTDLHLED